MAADNLAARADRSPVARVAGEGRGKLVAEQEASCSETGAVGPAEAVAPAAASTKAGPEDRRGAGRRARRGCRRAAAVRARAARSAALRAALTEAQRAGVARAVAARGGRGRVVAPLAREATPARVARGEVPARARQERQPVHRRARPGWLASGTEASRVSIRVGQSGRCPIARQITSRVPRTWRATPTTGTSP